MAMKPLRDTAAAERVLLVGVGWKRAQHWLTSPDPAYARKKVHATA